MGRNRLRGQDLDGAAEPHEAPREHRVPLSAEAMELIERMPRNSEACSASTAAASPWSR